MRVADGYDANTRPIYKDVRGPTGERYAAWKAGLAQRALDRFGLGFVDNNDGQARDARRLMRNARKRESQLARAS